MIYGHQQAQAQLERALGEGRLHQAYLLAGSQGIGKARFAKAWLPRLMGGQEAERLLAAGAHPDFMQLEIEADPKTGKLRRDIGREQVEKLLTFLTKHPVLAERKLVLIDAADDLSPNAANNLLKWLEEPRPKTCLLLIAHRVERLLPTLRSRCARLNFRPLDAASFARFAADQGLAQVEALHRLSGGVPGQALLLSKPEVTHSRQALTALVENRFAEDPLVLARQAKSLLPTQDIAGLALCLGMLRRALRDLAGQGGEAATAPFAADAYAKTLGQEARAQRLNLDPAQVLAMVLLDLQALAGQGLRHDDTA